MDPQVTCPRCKQRQPLPSPDGYRCVSCGTEWVFATCRSCGGRFHMDPATRAWRCPTCGMENDTAAPAPATPRAAPAPTPPRRGRSVFAGSERMPLIVLVVAAVIAIGLIWVWFGRGSDSPAPASPSTSASITSAQALATLCHDIPIDQNLRVDALHRTADQVRLDAKALRQTGDTVAAQKAVAVASAMDALATTLDTHGDTTADTEQLSAAIAAVASLCRSG